VKRFCPGVGKDCLLGDEFPADDGHLRNEASPATCHTDHRSNLCRRQPEHPLGITCSGQPDPQDDLPRPQFRVVIRDSGHHPIEPGGWTPEQRWEQVTKHQANRCQPRGQRPWGLPGCQGNEDDKRQPWESGELLPIANCTPGGHLLVATSM